MKYEKIGAFISECRKSKGYTQKQLASSIGLTDKAVSKWERGLGCPDVSVLEQLSDILGVSILEILRGERLNDDKILADEAKSIILDTVSYTKKNNLDTYKNMLSKVISYIIFFIGVYLFVLNISHIMFLNRKFDYDFNDRNMLEISNVISKMDSKINLIKQHKGKYKSDDYNKIIELLDNSYNSYKNLELLKYDGVKQYGYADFYVLDMGIPSSIEIIEIYEILENYDNSFVKYLDDFKNLFFLRGTSGIASLYKYQIYSFDLKDDEFDNYYGLIRRILNYKYLVNAYYDLLNDIIEVGAMDE